MRSILLILALSLTFVSCNQKPAASRSEAAPPKFTTEQLTQSFAFLAREREEGKARFAALDAVRDSAPYVSEFLRLFPAAEVNYRYFTTTTDGPGFDVEVDLYGRYQFTMQLPVRFDSERRKVVGYGEPKFYLAEATSQIGRDTRYNPAGERQFGSAQWRTVVEHQGDFSAIGYPMHTNQPVAGFRERKNQP